MKTYKKLIPLLLLTLFGSSIALAGGSSVGIDETNVRDKSLTAGTNDQLLMSFTVEPWESIPGDLKFTTIDLHCTPGDGFSNLTLMQAGQELASTEFIVGEEGKMRANFGEVDFTIPNGVATEFELLVDVEENTGDFITACALDNLEFLNLDSDTQYESGRYVFDFNIDTLVYVDDPTVEDRDKKSINILNETVHDDPLELGSQNNKLLELKLSASQQVLLEDLFIYCPNASELKDFSLKIDGNQVEPTAVHVDWLTVSRSEWTSDRRVVFSDLGLQIDSLPKSFELYAGTQDYFSNATGPSCRLMDMVARDVEVIVEAEPTDETPSIIYSDVSEANKYFEAISYLTQRKVFEGYEDGTFKPLKTLNRAELLKILVTGKEIFPTVEEGYHSCFPDVTKEWFAPFICYAKGQGWVNGYPDGNFYPGREVIKVEAIKMLTNSQGYPTPSVYGTDVLFTDVDKDKWYAPFVKAAKERGLLEETEIYGVSEKMNRGQISENIYRAMIIGEQELDYYSNPKEGALSYSNSQLKLSFEYPYDWKVLKEDDGEVILMSPKRYNMNYALSVTFPAESFEEYETLHREQIDEGYMSVESIEMTLENQTYSTKEYGQHGGLTYLAQVGDSYVKINTEAYFSDQQKEEIGVILNSLSFSNFSETQISPKPDPEPVDTSMCGSDSYNCSDFSTQSDAQSMFDQCMGAVGIDIHKLDGDNNGIACESTF